MSFISELVVFLITVNVALGQLRTYELQMDRLEIINSPGGNSFNFKTLRVTKFNRTIYVGKAEFEVLTKDMSKMEIAIFAQSMQGNVYKQLPYKINKQLVCKFYKNEYKTMIYDGIKDFSNLPAPDNCPFENVCKNSLFCKLIKIFMFFFKFQKELWVKNYVFDENTVHLPPHIDLGKHRIDILFYENGAESGGFYFYFNAVRPGQADQNLKINKN